MKAQMLDGRTVREIKVVPYSHHDYAWVCTRSWHKMRYIKCYSEILDKLKEIPDLTWCIDNVIHSWIPFLEYCPDRVDEFKKYVKEGRITILNGGYSLARPSYVGEETYIRNMMAGRKYFKDSFGIEYIPCLYNADTACGHSQLPQIARLGGQKYYRFQRPDALLTKKGIPLQFIWQGLDGSELLITRGFYGSMWADNDFLNNDFDSAWEATKKDYVEKWLGDKLIPEMPTETVIQFLGSDDCRPLLDHSDKPLRINEFMKEWNKREKVKMSYAHLNDICDELSEKDLPVYNGVLDHAELSYNFPFKGDSSMWRMRLILDRLIILCEKLCILAESMGFDYPKEEIEELWFDLFEITGHAIEFIQDKNTKELYHLASRAKYRAIALAERAKEFICNNAAKLSEIQAVLINTNTWDIEEIARFEVTTYHGIAGFDVVDLDGNKLEYQIADCQLGYSVNEGADYVGVEIYVKTKVPAMGYTSLKIIENGTSLKPFAEENFIDSLPAYLPPDCADKVSFSNGCVDISFYKGQILSFKNLETQMSVQSAIDSKVGNLKFIEFPPESSWVTLYNKIASYDFIPEHWKILAKGPLRFIYKVYGKIADEPASITYTLDKGSKGIEVEVESNFVNSKEGMLVYAVKADFDSEVYADIPFGTEKREFFDHIFYNPDTNEKLNFSAVEWEFAGQIYGRNWCSFLSENNPFAIVTQNCSVYYIFEKKDGEMQLVLNRSLPLHTRKDRWAGEMSEETSGNGKNNYNFSLLFAEKLGKSNDIQTYHKNKIFPPEAKLKFGTGNLKEKKAQDSLVAAYKGNIINTAVYKNNEKTLIRFFECNGETTTTAIRLPHDTIGVKAVDFEGNELSDILIDFNSLEKIAEVEFKPYKIITLELIRR